MLREVSKLQLVFENCEQVTIPASALGCVIIRDIHTEIGRCSVDAIYEQVYAGEVALEIFPNANQVGSYYTYDDGTKTIMERIAAPHDVTAINIIYDNGDEMLLYVDYSDGGNDQLGAPNIHQNSYFSKNGALYLIICKGKSVSDCFKLDEVDDESYAKLIQYTINMNTERTVDNGEGNH